MENHLIIGLGGTGGRVLAAFRKLMFEKFDGDVKPKDMWIDYLYMDSSEQDLKMRDPAQWEIMGKSIALDADSVVRIPAADLRRYVENRKQYPYLEPWLGDSEDWRNIINDPKISEGAAGQKRRLGRLLFANGAPEFNRMVGVKAKKLSHNPEGSKITYHVVAGLAGGTGSGAIVDVVAQLRHQFPNQLNNKILLYLLLPEESPNPTWASTDNYQPNGYVALGELSAMDLGIFRPWNIGERDYDVERLNLELPFYSAYLVTDTNQANVRFDVSKVMPATIAEFIFQKTVGVAESDRKLGKGRTESSSNFFNDVEKGENPKYSDYDTPHSFKYNGFGIKRLAVPEQEIKEYFGYSFANQAVLKMMFNNLSRESGYVAEASLNDDYAFVTDPKNQNRWCITRAHLMLSLPITNDNKKEGWKKINDEFGVVDDFRKKVMADDNLKHADKLIAIRNLTKRFYDKDFRPIKEAGLNGVENFYNDKTQHGRKSIVEHITETINSDLLEMWKTGQKSLSQLSGIVKTLLDYFDQEKSNLEKMEANARDEIKKRDALMDSLNKEWQSMGTLVKGLSNIGLNNRKDDVSSKYTAAVKDKYILMASSVSYTFARQLINDISIALQVTKSDIDSAFSQFLTAQESLLGAVNSRCIAESEEKQSLKGVVIKNYNPKKVHNMAIAAIANENDNNARIAIMGEGLVGMLNPEKRNFHEVAEKMKAGNIIAMLEEKSLEVVNKFFDTGVGKDYIPQYEKLIGVNIIEKLEKEFSGNPEGLKDKLEQLVRHAAITNIHEEAEVNMGPRIRSSMFVILPDYDQNPAFLQEVEDEIRSLTTEGNLQVSRGGNSNEIVIINLETNLTPRYLDIVGKLRKSYERLINSKQGKVARFETQLEDYDGFIPMGKDECIKLHKLPSLFKPTDKESDEIEKVRASMNNNENKVQVTANVGNSGPSASIVPPPLPTVSYYLAIEGQQAGPFDMAKLKAMVAQGTLTRQTLAWKNGMAGWTAAGEVAELANLFSTNTPPPLPPMA